MQEVSGSVALLPRVQSDLAHGRAGAGDLRSLIVAIAVARPLYPGIKHVEREYFYAVHGADDATRRGYLERAYALGRQF